MYLKVSNIYFDILFIGLDIVIMERIGGGFFGEVFRGRWNQATEIALKKVRKEHLASFESENQTLR
jgi:hypothetical protein